MQITWPSVELSDAAGVFAATPPVIGALAAIASGIVNCRLSLNIAIGSNYRVRIKSTSPVITGLTGSDTLTVGNRQATCANRNG